MVSESDFVVSHWFGAAALIGNVFSDPTLRRDVRDSYARPKVTSA
jgi:hypothetical protein